MKCVADVHFRVIRESTAKYWQEPNDYGEIRSLQCMFCDFVILKRYVNKPRSSKSGLGRYNRMRGQMVTHLHEKHQDKLREHQEQRRLKCQGASETFG